MKGKSADFSIIDKELTVEGAVSTTGKLVIKGTLKGSLEGETVIIAEEGSVFADARVTSMTIGGVFEGEVTATGELIILSSGKCSGRVVCRDFVVEAGGLLNADVSCLTTQKESPKPAGKKKT